MRQREFNALAMAVDSVQRLCERDRLERERSAVPFREELLAAGLYNIHESGFTIRLKKETE